jgi:hypothetical protein
LGHKELLGFRDGFARPRHLGVQRVKSFWPIGPVYLQRTQAFVATNVMSMLGRGQPQRAPFDRQESRATNISRRAEVVAVPQARTRTPTTIRQDLPDAVRQRRTAESEIIKHGNSFSGSILAPVVCLLSPARSSALRDICDIHARITDASASRSFELVAQHAAQT